MVTFPREDTDNETFFEDTNMTGKKKTLEARNPKCNLMIKASGQHLRQKGRCTHLQMPFQPME